MERLSRVKKKKSSGFIALDKLDNCLMISNELLRLVRAEERMLSLARPHNTSLACGRYGSHLRRHLSCGERQFDEILLNHATVKV